jgi:hypothetical protein
VSVSDVARAARAQQASLEGRGAAPAQLPCPTWRARPAPVSDAAPSSPCPCPTLRARAGPAGGPGGVPGCTGPAPVSDAGGATRGLARELGSTRAAPAQLPCRARAAWGAARPPRREATGATSGVYQAPRPTPPPRPAWRRWTLPVLLSGIPARTAARFGHSGRPLRHSGPFVEHPR